MSSKGVGSSSREDVTDSYKYKEKSREEREVMLKALRMCNNQFTSYLLNEKFEDIRFELMLLDDIVIGMPFTVIRSGFIFQGKNIPFSLGSL